MPNIPRQRSRRVIHRASSYPVYQQVAKLLELDMQGRRPGNEGAPLPSENELAAEFKVSRVTVRQALDELHRKGLIFREKGKGSYPRADHISGVTGFGSFTTEVQNAGSKPSSRFISCVTVPDLPAGMKRHLARIPEVSQAYYCLTRVRCVDDQPVALEETYLDAETYPDIELVDLKSGSLYATMRSVWGYEPAWADAAIEPGVADEAIARYLGIEIGAPVVIAWRVTSSEHDEVLEYVRAIYRGDGFALTIRRHKIV